jgi:hypothetical protein
VHVAVDEGDVRAVYLGSIAPNNCIDNHRAGTISAEYPAAISSGGVADNGAVSNGRVGFVIAVDSTTSATHTSAGSGIAADYTIVDRRVSPPFTEYATPTAVRAVGTSGGIAGNDAACNIRTVVTTTDAAPLAGGVVTDNTVSNRCSVPVVQTIIARDSTTRVTGDYTVCNRRVNIHDSTAIAEEDPATRVFTYRALANHRVAFITTVYPTSSVTG